MPALKFAVHALRDDVGAGGYATADIDSLAARLVADFESVGIQLIEISRADIHDSGLLADPVGSAATIFSNHSAPGCLNVFLGSPVGTVQGTVSGVPGLSLVLTGNAAGTSALSHFMGHCLGLYETDETVFGVELPDGSNSAVAGDLVIDTPAPASTANILTGGQVAAWEEFTPEQGARMRAAIELVDLLSESEYAAGVEYVDASALTGLGSDAYAGVPTNATAVDFSGDGVLDLVTTATSQLFKTIDVHPTLGVPSFTNRSSAMIPNEVTRGLLATAAGVVAADYDNDGDLDLYFPREEGHFLFRNQGGSSLVDVTTMLDNPLRGRPSLNAAWGDYDADGFVDLVVVIPSTNDEEGSSALQLFHNNAGSSFTADASKGVTGPFTHLRTVLWGDLNLDQRLDLIGVQTGPYLPYFPHYPPTMEGHHSQYWVQTADGNFTIQGLEGDDKHVQYRSCQAILMDVEPDGDLDLRYVDSAGAGHFTNSLDIAAGQHSAVLGDPQVIRYTIECAPPGECLEAVYRNMIDIDLCDFNLDGKPDYVAPDPDTYPYATLAIHTAPPARYTSTIKEDHAWYGQGYASGGVAVADIDENGSQDIYVARALLRPDNAGNQYYFRAQPSVHGDFGHWVGFKLRSFDPGCNRFALGATVVVSHGSGPTAYKQAQVVDGGSGRAGQAPLHLVYGLGDYTGTVDVTVYWPDGHSVQTYTGLAIGKYHTLQLGIQPSATAFTRTFNPTTGLYTWEFRWDTAAPTPVADDRVVITPDPSYQNCGPDPIVLSDAPPLVTATVVQVGSVWRHTMTLRDMECSAPCRFTYAVSSRYSGVTWELTPDKEFKTLYCATAP